MTIFRPATIGCLARSLTHAPRIHSSRTLQHGVPARSFSSTFRLSKKIDFIQRQEQKSEAKQEEATAKDDIKLNHKPPRKNAGKTSSLRSVAVQAQRSRSFVKSRGRQRFIDPDAATKTLTAYCAAETYDIAAAADLIKAQGYELDPYQTGLYPQVIHVQTSDRPSEVKDAQTGDIFVFPSGTLVTWNVREREALKLVQQILPPCAEGSHLDLLETEDLEYLEDPSMETSQVVGDTIVLGTKASPAIEDKPTDSTHDTDTTLAKIAFSSGLARSTKLAVLESLLAAYQSSTRSIPSTLSSPSPPFKPSPFTRSFILRKTGELLSIRAQLNLYSELTDSMPDIFWDSRHELGLGEYYDQVGRALDVSVRIRVLNEKIGFAQEIASVLREQLSEKHGLRLEWAIIALIAVEVVLELYRHWVEEGETERLLRGWLEREMGAEGGKGGRGV